MKNKFFIMLSDGNMDIVNATYDEHQELIDILMDKVIPHVNPVRELIIHCVINGGQVWELHGDYDEEGLVVQCRKYPEYIQNNGVLIYEAKKK